MTTKKCLVCEKEIISKIKKVRFCSDKCHKKFDKPNYISARDYHLECKNCKNSYIGHFNSKFCESCKTKVCQICNKKFVAYGNHPTCSEKCGYKLNKRNNAIKFTRHIKSCPNCKKEFILENKEIKQYCSKKCFHEYNKKLTFCNEIKCSNEFCQNIMMKSNTELKNSETGRFYCSVRCLNIGRSQKASEMRKCTGTKPELKFADLLQRNNIDYCIQYWINWKRGWKKFYDFYLPNIDTLIEIDGVYWHGKGLTDIDLNDQQKYTRNNDMVKNQLAIDQDYKLIRIWEDEIDCFDFNQIKG